MTLSELSVLVVEDEVIVAIELGEVLRDMGFRDVRVAHNLRRAEQEIAAALPDVAILDVNLGAGERTIGLGLKLAEKGTRIVFASGYNKSELAAEIQSFDFVEKPVSSDDIRAKLKAMLAVG